MQKLKSFEENSGISEIHRAEHIEIKLFYNTFFVWAFLISEKDILFIEFLSSSVFHFSVWKKEKKNLLHTL